MKTFDERFMRVYPAIQRLARRYANSSTIPYEEYESYLCEELIGVDKSFDRSRNDGYVSYVMSMLETKAKRMAHPDRKERKYYDNVNYLEPPDETDDDAKYPLELVADVNIEEEVFDVMFVEEQLAKADGDTRLILAEFFKDPSASFREIARNLGMNDKLVKRRLEAVAENVRNGSSVKSYE